MRTQALASPEFKGCCSRLYEEKLLQFLLGPSLHPGGLDLTRRLAKTMNISSSDIILDVASGLGETARLLSLEYGCRVFGVDLSGELVRKASAMVVSDQTSFARGDGEALPFRTGSFTALLSECSMCLLPEMLDALGEARRVLQKGGRLGLTDIAVLKTLPPELEDVLMSFLCLSSKVSPTRYSGLVEEAGFSSVQIADVSESLQSLLEGIRKRLLLVELMSGLGKLSLQPGQLERGKRLLSQAQDALDNGSLGYFMLTAERS
jgi:arsenite methyltransferase